MTPILEFKNLSKCFGSTLALHQVSFDIREGEIHCLCGENGAGKSTLINLCSGVLQPTEGEILVDGKVECISDVKCSEQLGIAVVHQEVPLCQNMSIAHNLFLGHKISKGIFLNERYMQSEADKLLNRFDLPFQSNVLVGDLSIAEQSIIQIAKAVYYEPRILILDEPTAALANNQRDILFKIIRELVEKNNTTVLYVSHRLEEVMELGDRVTVLRDGCYINTWDVKDITIDQIVSSMVGREINKSQPRQRSASDGDVLLRVKNLCKNGKFNDINLEVHSGEIVGLAGFVGAGRTEVLSAIFGALKPDSGEVYVKDKCLTQHNCSEAISSGISMIPENRRDDAIIPELSIQQNAHLVIRKDLVNHVMLDKQKSRRLMDEMINEYTIKVSDPKKSMLTLSGGNQQKVIIARWIANHPTILLCDEPARGIDVGAKAEIYEILNNIADDGVGVLVASSDLPELLMICDRIIVMHEGKITGEVSRSEANEERIMQLAAGL